jgi:DNA anti-recombination protein RmuC
MASDVGVQIELRVVDKITTELKKISIQFNKFEDNIRKIIPVITNLNNQIDNLSRKLNNNISLSFKKINSTIN